MVLVKSIAKRNGTPFYRVCRFYYFKKGGLSLVFVPSNITKENEHNGNNQC